MKNFKKTFVIFSFIFLGNFFINAQSTNTIADCLFFDAEGLIGAPSYYKDTGFLGKIGFGGGFEVGYNIRDVLFSIKYQNYTTPKIKINQNFWYFQLSKVFRGKEHILDLRPSIGWGANVISIDSEKESGVCLAANLSLFMDVININYFKPYFGLVGNVSFYNKNLLITPYGVIGLRIATF